MLEGARGRKSSCYKYKSSITDLPSLQLFEGGQESPSVGRRRLRVRQDVFLSSGLMMNHGAKDSSVEVLKHQHTCFTALIIW